MGSSNLSTLQREFLEEFFRREDRFFLSGGAALVGFYLGHRETHDLDLFTVDDVMDAGIAAAVETVRQLGASCEAVQTAPDFRRLLVRRGIESVVIDLVYERTTQVAPEKPVLNGIRVDPPEEILANKLCALLSRSEIRDLVDVRALELAGYRIEDALPAAARKDSGLTPAQLAWVLSEIRIGEDMIPPGGASTDELRQYLANLIERLTQLSFPVEGS